MFQLFNGDCLDLMVDISDEAIDMILCDLPYGTTYCSWDAVIPLDILWSQYKRIIKPTGAIVLTASQPFTSALVMSNPGMFRCEWIWNKVNGANFANSKKQPLKIHESVLVFSKKPSVYYPIKTPGAPNHKQGNSTAKRSETMLIKDRSPDDLSGLKFPTSIQTFPKHSSQGGLHPTQKPVPLMEYFIRTYSLEGETVLDNCMGSGTTGVARINTNREFIGIEKSKEYFEIANKRIAEHSPPSQENKSPSDERIYFSNQTFP